MIFHDYKTLADAWMEFSALPLITRLDANERARVEKGFWAGAIGVFLAHQNGGDIEEMMEEATAMVEKYASGEPQ